MNWDDTGPDTDERLDERLVDAGADGEDTAVEAALRPKDLDEFVGQEKVREQLDLVLKAALARGATADHVLLSGAPGLGKTTLSMIIAAEMGAPIRITSGPAIQHAGDLAAILSSLQEGEVLFLDEIHRMSRPAEEMLYMAMEDFRVDVIVGKGPGATAIPLELPPFTLVGATTRAGLLPPPLRDRFGFTGHMEFYAPAELERVIHRSARLLDVAIDADGAAEIAGRSRGTPRIANRLLRRVRDYAQVKADGRIDRTVAAAALRVYEVDARGLDRLDRAVLGALLKLFGGGPVGLSTLAVAVGRSARRSRRSRSPSWYGKVCWPGRRGAGSPPRRPGPIWVSSPRPTVEKDNRVFWGVMRHRLAQIRNRGAMLGVVPSMRTRLDSADAVRTGRRAHPRRSGRISARSCEGNSSRESRDSPPLHRAHRGHVPDDPVRQEEAGCRRADAQRHAARHRRPDDRGHVRHRQGAARRHGCP